MDEYSAPRQAHVPDVYDNKTANPCKIHVSALCMDTTNDGLRKYFENFGEVIDAIVMKNWQTGFSRRFGFVTFKNVETVDHVLKATHVLDGKTIEVTRAVVKGLVHVKSSKIYVAALPFEVTSEELRGYFSAYGTVENAEVMANRETGRSRGFGFVTFVDLEVARTVIAREHMIRDRKVVVKAAEPRGSAPLGRFGRGGGRGGYPGGYPANPAAMGYGYENYGYQRGYEEYQQAAADYSGMGMGARGYDERSAYAAAGAGRGYHPYAR
eukprot:CAMPEP_0201487702 /NCGR_PEP_ID=MMETSP0151_2-20130828/15175_1 /ASSEMBLY_ACC=CAM_ASM_000257 /TAXON_ID=200890 /ORGANISM="Paramoeba atlantica, Strain 621/1 / CCAP 1560/9" /LENGTH=267 /DNA_ID=CAMNT_0047872827 /DNA_START=52 /DNA_END=855 /DNA_ORIENTATION=-